MSKAQIAYNLKLKSSAEEITKTVENIDFYFFKGASLFLKGIYQVEERICTDIDIIVRPCELDVFCAKLIDLGYERYIEEEAKPNAVIFKRGEIYLDIHKHIFNFSEFPFKNFPFSALIDGLIFNNQQSNQRQGIQAHLLSNELEYVIILFHGLFSLFKEARWQGDLRRLWPRISQQEVMNILEFLKVPYLYEFVKAVQGKDVSAVKVAMTLLRGTDSKIFFLKSLLAEAFHNYRQKGYKKPLNYALKVFKDLSKVGLLPKK